MFLNDLKQIDFSKDSNYNYLQFNDSAKDKLARKTLAYLGHYHKMHCLINNKPFTEREYKELGNRLFRVFNDTMDKDYTLFDDGMGKCLVMDFETSYQHSISYNIKQGNLIKDPIQIRKNKDRALLENKRNGSINQKGVWLISVICQVFNTMSENKCSLAKAAAILGGKIKGYVEISEGSHIQFISRKQVYNKVYCFLEKNPEFRKKGRITLTDIEGMDCYNNLLCDYYFWDTLNESNMIARNKWRKGGCKGNFEVPYPAAKRAKDICNEYLVVMLSSLDKQYKYESIIEEEVEPAEMVLNADLIPSPVEMFAMGITNFDFSKYAVESKAAKIKKRHRITHYIQNSSKFSREHKTKLISGVFRLAGCNLFELIERVCRLQEDSFLLWKEIKDDPGNNNWMNYRRYIEPQLLAA